MPGAIPGLTNGLDPRLTPLGFPWAPRTWLDAVGAVASGYSTPWSKRQHDRTSASYQVLGVHGLPAPCPGAARRCGTASCRILGRSL